jgi:hypothetical protein
MGCSTPQKAPSASIAQQSIRGWPAATTRGGPGLCCMYCQQVQYLVLLASLQVQALVHAGTARQGVHAAVYPLPDSAAGRAKL